MVHADTGRVIASPFRNDAVTLGITYAEDGYGRQCFIVVYIWSRDRVNGNAISYAGRNRYRTFATLPEAREYVNANHSRLLADYLNN